MRIIKCIDAAATSSSMRAIAAATAAVAIATVAAGDSRRIGWLARRARFAPAAMCISTHARDNSKLLFVSRAHTHTNAIIYSQRRRAPTVAVVVVATRRALSRRSCVDDSRAEPPECSADFISLRANADASADVSVTLTKSTPIIVMARDGTIWPIWRLLVRA